MKTKRIAMALAGMVGTMAQAAPPPGLLAPVAVEDLPARRVAYVEQVGNFQNNPGIYDVLLQKLLDWALPAGRWDFPAKTLIACIYPDDPAATPPEQQRLWLGITIPADAVPPAGIQVLTLPAGPMPSAGSRFRPTSSARPGVISTANGFPKATMPPPASPTSSRKTTRPKIRSKNTSWTSASPCKSSPRPEIPFRCG